jgi:hypothetical protein
VAHRYVDICILDSNTLVILMLMKKGDKIKLEIPVQGAPIVNYAHVCEVGENIVAIEIDMMSKYCEVDAFVGGSVGECGIYIGTNSHSLKLNKNVVSSAPTLVEFPQFNGWHVFSAHIGRYNVSVCLIKR